MSEDSSPHYIMSDLTTRVSNSEQAILNLNQRFDRFETSVSDQFKNVSNQLNKISDAHVDASNKLFEKLDNLNTRELQSKQWKGNNIIAVISLIWVIIGAIMGFTIIQTNEIQKNKIQQSFVAEHVSSTDKRTESNSITIRRHDIDIAILENEISYLKEQIKKTLDNHN